MKKFGDVLRKERLRYEFTQAELADKIGTTQAYYNRIENSKYPPPSLPILETLAKILKYDLSKLRKLADITRIEFKQEDIKRQRERLGLETSQSHPIPILSEIPFFIPKSCKDFPPEIIEAFHEPYMDPNSFFYRVEGDFMVPEIKEGDLVLICPVLVNEVKSGDIVAITNGKGVRRLRRVTFEGDHTILTADNPAYPVMVWKKEDKPKIIGRVEEIIRRR
ncbi:LexA repressor [subsurface metagenome]